MNAAKKAASPVSIRIEETRALFRNVGNLADENTKEHIAIHKVSGV